MFQTNFKTKIYSNFNSSKEKLLIRNNLIHLSFNHKPDTHLIGILMNCRSRCRCRTGFKLKKKKNYILVRIYSMSMNHTDNKALIFVIVPTSLPNWDHFQCFLLLYSLTTQRPVAYAHSPDLSFLA